MTLPNRLCCLLVLIASLVLDLPPARAAYSQTQLLQELGTGHDYGASIDVQGDEMVIANLDQSEVLAYVYRRQGGQWAKVQTLLPDLEITYGTISTGYPTMVDIDGDTLVVGAPFANFGGMNARGAVYVYVRSGGSWVLQQRLIGEDGPANATGWTVTYGNAVALDGDTLVVGAPGRNRLQGYTAGSGAAYVYTRSAGTWTLRKQLLSPAANVFHAFFGNALDIDDGRVLVGEWGNHRAYLYAGAGDSWTLGQTFAPGDGNELGANFGTAVRIRDDRIAIGASAAQVNGENKGAVYLFLHDGGQWGQLQRVVPGMGYARGFGAAIDITPTQLLVGAPHTVPITLGGRAELFESAGLFYSYNAGFEISGGASVEDRFGAAVALTPQGVAVADPFRIAAGASGNNGQLRVYEPPQPELQLSTASLDFGNVAVDGSALKSLLLLNVGDDTLYVSDIDAAAGPFSRQGGSCGNLLPILIAPGHNCTLNYRFAPTGTGSFQQVINIASNDPLGDKSLTLGGSGVTAQLSLTPSYLNVGTAVLGDTTAVAMTTLRNDGGATLSLASIAAPTAPFAAAGGNCPGVPFDLGPGASCTLGYTFTASSAGEAIQGIGIVSNSATSPDQLLLYGYGEGPGLSISPQPVDFGGVAVGAQADINVQLFSSGLTAVTIDVLPEPQPPFTQIASNCGELPIVLPADTSCVVSYRFTPTAAGPVQTVLAVESNGPESTQPLTLTGEGLQPALLLSPAQLDFGARLPGEQQDLFVTLGNVGGLDLDIDAFTSPDAPFSVIGGSCIAPPFTLAPMASCTLNLRFAPTATGPFDDLILIASNAPGAPHALALHGEGADPQLLLSPANVDFGYVMPGGSSAEVQVDLHSSGGVKVTVDDIGDIPAPFVLVASDCPSPPFSILGAEGCSLTLRFDPPAGGAYDEDISITSDANNSPTLLQLHGVGGSPPPAIFADGFEG